MNIYLLLAIGIIPSLAWLIFYLKEDLHPEPKKLILYTFLAGAASTIVVLAFQYPFKAWLVSLSVNHYLPLPVFAMAAIEEIFKFLAAFAIIHNHREDFNEPIDAMIYMIVAALGFATVENIGAIFNNSVSLIETVSLRFIGATLLHTIASGVLGYYWALYTVNPNPKKAKLIMLWGFFSAIVLHTIFNLLIIKFDPLYIPTIFLIVLAIFLLYDFEKIKRLPS